MQKLIKIEWIKAGGYPVFWVITGIIAGLFILLGSIGAIFDFRFFVGLQTDVVDIKNFFRFPHIWNSFTYLASWFNKGLAILVIIMISNEFSYRTFRQHIIDGVSRTELFLSKLIMIIGIALIFIVLVIFLSLLYGFINMKEFSAVSFFDKSYYLIVYFIQALAYMSFGMLISLALKNGILSIVVYFGYIIFEALIRWMIDLMNWDFYRFFPMRIISDLTPAPSLEVATGQPVNLNITQPVADLPLYITVSLAVIYMCGFLFLSHLIIKKRDF